MIRPPANQLIVLPKSKFTSAVTNILKESSIQNGATVDPTDLVSITGEIVAIPHYISPHREYLGFSTKDLKVGDIAIFSYRVIYDHKVEVDDKGEIVLKHRNSLFYQDKEYFLCNIRELFGVIRNGEIIMVNGYVMVAPHEESTLILPNKLRRLKGTVSSQVMYVGSSRTNMANKFHVKQGDYAVYSPIKCQKYKINGKPFSIVPMQHILGTYSPEPC